MLFFGCEAREEKPAPPPPKPAAPAVKNPLKDNLSVNQIGFVPGERKQCVLIAGPGLEGALFSVLGEKGETAFRNRLQFAGIQWQKHAYIGDFTQLNRTGVYRISAGGMTSPSFEIADDVWKKRVGAGKILGSFFRKQRCIEETYKYPKDMDGTHKDIDRNLPVYELKPADGKGREAPDGRTFADALGGWHDATSTDKETAKIAYSAQMMMLATAYGPDYFTAEDDSKLEAEIRWGIQFLFKMQDGDGGVFLAVKPHDWWLKDSLPRRLLANKETGVTARTVACWATAASYFRQRDPALSEQCLAHALKGWEWIEKNPNSFLSTKTYPDYWTGKTSSLLWAECELFLTLRESDPQRAQPFLQKASDLVRSSSMEEGVWIPASGVHDPDAVGAAINEQTIPAMCRLLPHLDSKLQDKVRDNIAAWLDFWRDQTDPAYGLPENMLTPLFGLNGWASQLAVDMLMAGMTLPNSEMIERGRNLVQWIFGRNPFAVSFVVGFGENDVKDPFKRPYQDSIGGVVPGVLDVDGDRDPEMKGREEWQTQECCLDYSASLLFDLAVIHQLTESHR